MSVQSSDPPGDPPDTAGAEEDPGRNHGQGRRQDVVELEERGWLTRHSRGDASAFPALMAAYRRPVYRYLVRAGLAEADRDDLFQNIFLKIHSAAASYDPARPLAPWLFTIVANTVRGHNRAQPVPGTPLWPHESAQQPDPNPGPERIIEARETVSWLQQALAALPAISREVLLLSTVAGLPQQAVAESLDLPLNTVKTHLRRSRLALAAGLARRDEAGVDSQPVSGEFDAPL